MHTLSQTALRAVGNGNRLSVSRFTEVLQANTDVLRTPGFMEYLSSGLPNPLPQTTLDMLQTAAGTVTARGTLEAQMQDAYKEVLRAGNDWIITAKTDSTGAEQQNLPLIYAQIPALGARYALAGDYLIQGDSAGCDNVMGTILEDFDLDTAQMSEHSAYTTLWNALKGIDFTNRQPGSLSSTQVTSLQGIGNEESAGAIAKAAIRFNGLIPSGNTYTKWKYRL